VGYRRADVRTFVHRIRAALAAHPCRVDAAIATALALPALVQVLAFPIAPRALGVVIALLSTVPIAWRTVHPVAATLVGTAPWLVPTHGQYVIVGYIAVLFLLYSVGAHVDDPRVVVGVLAWVVALTIFNSAINDEIFPTYVGALTAVIAPVCVGRFVRRQRAQARRLALAEERARVARELHDVVGHGLSVIAVQSDAAEAALDRDPELARAPLRAIHSSAAESLAEMRRMLGLLRAGDEEAGRAPQPGLAELSALVERSQAAGVPVTLEQSGTPRPLPAGVDLSAYRIVQEALTNVRKHAGGAAAAVRVAWQADAVALEIRDSGPGPAPGAVSGGGHGLTGMRERARLCGGELRTGPGSDGGFVVEAVLPA
jgi:signal transduction histidine kinase